MATIDQRIVQMVFDNSKFEAKIKTTIESLNKLKTSLNIGKATSEFDKLENAANNVSFAGMAQNLEDISSRFSNMGIVGMTVLSNLTTSAMQAGKSIYNATVGQIISGGKKRALNIEQAKFQIDGLGYKWEEVEGDINYGVKGTAYGLDSAAKAASQLLASQVQIGDEMKAALRGISGVAAMTGSEYEDIANIFTTVAGNGKLMGDQLMQMSSRGLNAAAILGKSLHKSETEIREMVSKGKIDFKTFATIMDTEFGDHAVKANETFTGSLSNMKAALSRIGAEFATPAYQNLRDFFNILTPRIDEVKAALKPLITSASEGMKVLSTFATTALGSVNLEEALAGPLSQVNLMFRSLAKTAANVAKAIAKVLTPIATAFSSALGGTVLDILVRVAQALENFSSQLIMSDRMSENLRKTFQGIFTIMSVVLDVLSNLILMIATPLVTVATRSFGFIADVLLTITAFLSDIILAVKAFVDEVLELTVVKSVVLAVTTVINTLLNAIDMVATAFHGLVTTALDGAFSGLTFIFTNFSGAVLLVAHALDDVIVKVATWISELRELPIVQETISNISNSFTNLQSTVGYVTGIVKSKLVAAFNVASKAVSAFTTKVRDLIAKYVQLPTAQEAVARIQQFVIDLFTNSKTVFENVKELIGQIVDRVKDITEVSLAKAVENFNTLKNKIVEVVDAANRMEALKRLLVGLRDGFMKFSFSTGDVLNQAKGKFLEFIAWMETKFSNLTLGDVIAAGVGASIIPFFISLTKLIETTNKVAESIGKIAKIGATINKAIKTISEAMAEVVKAKAFAIKMEAVKGLITSVVLLAGAIALLASMDPERVQSSAIALGVLAGALIGVTVLIAKLSDNFQGAKLEAAAAIMVTISGSMLALSLAMKILSSIDMEGIGGRLVVMGVMMAELAAFTIALSKFAPEMSKGSVSIVTISISLLLLARAMSKIGDIDGASLISSVTVLGILMVFLGVVSKIAGSKGSVKSALGVIGIALALNLMIGALKTLSNLDSESVSLGMNRLIEMMGVLAVLLIATSVAGKHAAKAGIAIVIISLAMHIMIGAIEKIASMDQGAMSKASKTINEMLKIFALITLTTAFAGKHAVQAGVAIGMMSASMLILAAAMALMAKIDPDDLERTTDAVMNIMAMFALIVAATSMVQEAHKTLTVITIAVMALSGALLILSLIDPSNLETASKALNSLIACFALLVGASGLMTKGNATIVLMLAVVAGLALVLKSLADLPFETVLSASDSLSTLLLSLSASMFVLQFVNAPAALAGTLAMVAVIGVLGTLMAALGALVTEVPEVQQFIETGIPVLEALGEGLGSFIGGIVSGVVGSASNGLVTLGSNLSQFMENLQPFLDGCRNIDDSVIESVGNIVLMIGAFTATNIMDGLNFFHGNAIEELSTNLPILGRALVEFTKTLAGVDLDTLSMGSAAASMLGELLSSLPRDGGVFGLFTGEVDLDKFSASLPKFGLALVAFAGSVAGLATGNIEKAIEPAKALVEINNSIEKEGGLAGGIFGSSSEALSKLSENLPTFGRALTGFSLAVAGLNASNIENAVGPAKAVVEINNSIKAQGGLVGGIFGTTGEAMTKLTENLPKFGEALTKYGNEVANLNTGAVSASIEPAKALVEIFKSLKNEGGAINFIAGSNDIASKGFIDNVKSLGERLKEFSDSVKGLDLGAVNDALGVTNSILEIFKLLDTNNSIFDNLVKSGTESGAAKSFNGAIWGLGVALQQFSDSVTGVKRSSNALLVARDLVDIFNLIESSGGLGGIFGGDKAASLNSLAYVARPLGEGIKAFADSVAELPDSGPAKRATALARSLVEVCNLINPVAFLESDKIGNFSNGIIKIGTALVNFNEAVDGKINPGSISSTIMALRTLQNFSTGDMASFTGLDTAANAIENVGNKFRSFGDNINEVNFDNVRSTVYWLNTLKTVMADFKDFDVTPLENLGNAVKTAGDASVNGLVTAFQNGGASVTDAAKRMVDAAANAAVAALTRAQSRFNTAGVFLAVHLSNGITSGSDRITNTITELMDSLVASANSQASRFHEIGNIIAIWLSGGIQTSKASINGAVASIISTAFSKANSESGKFRTTGRNIVTYISQGVRSSASILNSALVSVVNAASNLSGYQRFYNIGKNFAQGLADGIDHSKFKAVVAARAMANEAAKAAAEALVVRSPSRRLYKVGRYFVEGFRNAIVDYTGSAVDASTELADSTANAMTDAMDRVYAIVSNSLDYTPTIAPVFDVTSIKRGTDSITKMLSGDYGVNATWSSAMGAVGDFNRMANPVSNQDVVTAIDKLAANITKLNTGSTTVINGVTYDDGSGISSAVGQLVDAITVGGRM